MGIFKLTSVNPPGYDYTEVRGVSASGEEAVYASQKGVLIDGLAGKEESFNSINIPGGLSVGLSGITEGGDVFGSYSTGLGGQGVLSGFVDSGGVISTISYPGSTSTQITGIDNDGDIVGNYQMPVPGGITSLRAFFDYKGAYVEFTAGLPGGAAHSTTILGINPFGQAFGWYEDNGFVNHGFVYSSFGGFWQIDVPGATVIYVTGDKSVGGVVTGGPNFGKAVGSYTDKSGTTHGFIDFNGSISTIDVPGATGTNIAGINDSGEIVGNYTIASDNGLHGFVYDYGVFYKFDFPGSSRTFPRGVNAEGEFYGSYTANGLTSGFVGSLSLFDQSSAPHANDLSYSSTASGPNHFVDVVNFEASYPDLVAAFGVNNAAMQNWYNTNEARENRPETFDGLDYVASHGDLMSAFGGAGSMKAVQDDGASHYINYGGKEGRTTSFNGLDYIASYSDLIGAFGADNDTGAYHYIEHGHTEGRTTTFDGLDYIASYGDLIKPFGANEQAGAAHFIEYGHKEGRTTTFDGLDYIANHTDLMKAFGANNDAGATHYIDYGLSEHRSTSFNVGAYESAHPDLIGKFSSNDAFLTAYINTYKATGTFMT